MKAAENLLGTPCALSVSKHVTEPLWLADAASVAASGALANAKPLDVNSLSVSGALDVSSLAGTRSAVGIGRREYASKSLKTRYRNPTL